MRVRVGLWASVLVTLVIGLLAPLASSITPALAQAELVAYTSPTYGYTVHWDEPWSGRSSDIESEGDIDTIKLRGDRGMTLKVVGALAGDTDAGEAVEDAISAETDDSGGAIWTVVTGDQPGANFIEGDDRVQIEGFVLDTAVVVVTLRAPKDDFNEAYDAAAADAGISDRDALVLDPETGPEAADSTNDEGDLVGVNGDAYESPTWGYTFEIDGSVWSFEYSATEDDRDRVVLSSADGIAVLVADTVGSRADPESCRDDLFAQNGEDDDTVTDAAIAENADGDQLQDGTDLYAWAVYTFAQGDNPDDLGAGYLECRSLADGDGMFMLSAITPDRSTFNQFIVSLLEVTDTIELIGNDNPSGSVVTAEEIELPTSGDPDDAEQGDTANSYSSDVYGYSVSWDEEIWNTAESTDDEIFSLDNGTTLLQFLPIAYTGELQDGFDEFISASSMEGSSTITEWEAAEDATGDPLMGTTSRGVYGVFTYTFTDPDSGRAERRVAYLEFRSLVKGESILAMIAVTFNRTTYNADIEQVLDVIATLQLADDDPVETPEPDRDVTPEADDEPTPEDEPEDYPDIDDGIWIMRPNTDYVN